MDAAGASIIAQGADAIAKARVWPRDCKHRGEPYPRNEWEPIIEDPGKCWKVWGCDKYHRRVIWRDCGALDKKHSCAEPCDNG